MQDELDNLLDKALASYGKAPAGLGKRLLAEVRRPEDRMRTLDWQWRLALPTTAVALLVFSLLPAIHFSVFRLQTRAHSETGLASGQTSTVIPGQAAPLLHGSALHHAALPVSHVVDRIRAGHSEEALHREIFPSPQPVTSAEQDFAAYLRQASLEERQKLVESHPELLEAVHFAKDVFSPIASQTEISKQGDQDE